MFYGFGLQSKMVELFRFEGQHECVLVHKNLIFVLETESKRLKAVDLTTQGVSEAKKSDEAPLLVVGQTVFFREKRVNLKDYLEQNFEDVEVVEEDSLE